MTETGIITLLLIIANVAFSYKGFLSQTFLDENKFEIDGILIRKEYKRLITSGFLHVSWKHLIFNMVSLYAFSWLLESYLGGAKFLFIYFTSLLGGGLLSLLIHRNHGEYSAVGASGAVCGIIFASIVLFPEMDIGFFGLPLSIPGWLYGLIFVLYSIYGIKSQKGNIGHDAHLGGALIGMTSAIAITPTILSKNYLTISIIVIPTIAFIYLIITKPHILFIDSVSFSTRKKYFSIEDKYNTEKREQQNQIDKILEKISSKGMNSLTTKEKKLLEEYSQKLR